MDACRGLARRDPVQDMLHRTRVRLRRHHRDRAARSSTARGLPISAACETEQRAPESLVAVGRLDDRSDPTLSLSPQA
jgi:hypothetical protein